MRASRLLSIFTLLVIGAVASGQGMPPPSAEISKFSWALGEWEGTSVWNMDGMPANTESKDIWTFEIEGQFLKMTTTATSMGQTSKETSYCGWNAEKKQYDSWAFSDIATVPRIEHGTFDGTTMTMESEPWTTMMGTITGRGTVAKKSDAEMTFSLEFRQPDGTWKKVAEGTYKKKMALARAA
jgi:hypothetical protein